MTNFNKNVELIHVDGEFRDKIHSWMQKINQQLNISDHLDHKLCITESNTTGIGFNRIASYAPIEGGLVYKLDITDYSTW